MAGDDREADARRSDATVPMSTPTPMPWTGAGGWNGADGRTGSIEAVRAAEADARQATLDGEPVGERMPRSAASTTHNTTGAGVLRRARWLLGAFSLAFAALTVVLLVTGLTLAFGKDYAASTSVGFAAIASSIIGFIMGGAAVIMQRGRALGLVAVVVSVLANPVALTQILGWFGAVG